MTLIKSISGIRGTIGGIAGNALTPMDIVKFTTAFGAWIKQNSGINKVVIGRDARVSGDMVSNLVVGSLQGLGIDVLNLGYSTTPTVEIAVPLEKAGGGIVVTASHNPKQWNALKLLNEKGEFISAEDGEEVLELAETGEFEYAEVDDLGKIAVRDYYDIHIQQILDLPLVDKKAIAEANFKIVVDAVNSTGGIAVPKLLKALGVTQITELFCEVNGKFPHNPEPLPENLSAISNEIKKTGADLGVVVDPDVDRLALVCEDGSMFGEEYTLVAISDYVLQHQKGNTVSNLSSTRALRDVTEKAGCSYFPSAVGEVNVVQKMKEVKAVIGGEGNGGVIYPELHYGRDALVGIALFLTHLAKYGKTVSMLRSEYPAYHISKNKVQLDEKIDIENLFKKLETKYENYPQNREDGLKIDFEEEWVHLRKSNTEPVVRIYAESTSMTTADNIAKQIISDIKSLTINRQ